MNSAADKYAQMCKGAERLPDVFCFLAEADLGDSGSRSTLDILLVDQYYRWSRSQAIPVEHYLQRLPELSSVSAVQLLVEEYGHLDDRGLAPPSLEFIRRYQSLGEGAIAQLCEALDVDLSGSSESKSDSDAFPSPLNPSSSTSENTIGRYQTICSIGRGAFGEVFLGRDPKLERSVAIKVLNKTRIELAGGSKALLEEARVVAKLDHANIVPVYDFGETDDGGCFIVSKFVKGKELRSEIRKPIAHVESAQITAALARALHAAHREGVVHRDVKPANILLDSKRQPHLLDFGLALRKTDPISGAGLVGTPAYMSPEQARGESHLVDGRSDIFSLGVIFYEMLAGRRPFQATGSDKKRKLLESAEAQPPRQFVDSIPRELEHICLKALESSVSKRFNTAGDFAEELELWIANESSNSATGPQNTSASAESSIKSATSVLSTNLPCRRDALLGRETEVADISDQLIQQALVSIVGTGGAGKTSLAMEVGRRVSARFPGGVWVCEFAPTRQPDQLLDVLVQVLFGNAGSLLPLDKAIERLQAQPTLLIFDNCEHLIDAIAELTETLFRRVANLKVLATSREALNVTGEFVYRVEGLSQTEADNSAAELFLARASALSEYRHRFEHDETIAKIVSQLEGLPLAIELAAAQLATISIEELLRALDNQMETLQTRRRSNDRQATATQTIQWSFDLLSSDQQQALMAMSVFVAPFTRDAAVAVADLPDCKTRVLQRLVEQSMVARTESNGRSRFRLLEPIRQFCQLRIADDVHENALRRHAHFYAARAPDLGAGVFGFNELEMAEALDIEWPDLRKAIAWGRDHLVSEVAIDPIVAIGQAVLLHARVEAYQWMDMAVERIGDEAAQRYDVQRIVGTGLYFQGDVEFAIENFRQSLKQLETAESLLMLYSVLSVTGDYKAALVELDRLEQFLLANPDDRVWRIWPTLNLTRSLGSPLDPEFDENLRLAKENAMSFDWPTGQSYTLLIQGMILSQRGDSPELRECLRQAIELAESCGTITYATTAGLILAGCEETTTSPHQRLVDVVGRVRVYFETGVESKGTTYMPLAVRAVVSALMESGEPELAAKISGLAADLKGVGEANQYSPHYAEQLQQLADSMEPKKFQQLQCEGRKFSIPDVIQACEDLLEKYQLARAD